MWKKAVLIVFRIISVSFNGFTYKKWIRLFLIPQANWTHLERMNEWASECVCVCGYGSVSFAFGNYCSYKNTKPHCVQCARISKHRSESKKQTYSPLYYSESIRKSIRKSIHWISFYDYMIIQNNQFSLAQNTTHTPHNALFNAKSVWFFFLFERKFATAAVAALKVIIKSNNKKLYVYKKIANLSFGMEIIKIRKSFICKSYKGNKPQFLYYFHFVALLHFSFAKYCTSLKANIHFPGSYISRFECCL